MRYAFAIVLVHAVLAVQGRELFHTSRPADDIEALCADKPVALYYQSELEYLVSYARGSSCSRSVRESIRDLMHLINQTEDDVCAQQSIDKLRQFYYKYLDTSTEENKQREQLPESLRDLALAYGMQMSNICKKRMVNFLTDQNEDVMSTETHEAIRHLVSDTSPVAEMLKGLAGPDEILLPVDLAPYIKKKQHAEGASLEDDTVYVQSATGPYIRAMQTNCNQVFAPIYKPLIRPIVQLTNMGFNYKDKPLRCDMGCSQKSKQLAKWSRLVFLCESLNNIRMVDVPQQAGPEDAEVKNVRILTKEEAVALDMESVSEPHPQVVERKFSSACWYHDLIFDTHDKRLKKAIKAFSTSKSEDEKVAARMMGKGFSMLKAQLKQHTIGLFFSKGYKAIVHRIRTGEKLTPNEEIVKLLDGAIEHESEFHDSHVDAAWENTKVITWTTGKALVSVVVGIMHIAFVVLLAGLSILDALLFNGGVKKMIESMRD